MFNDITLVVNLASDPERVSLKNGKSYVKCPGINNTSFKDSTGKKFDEPLYIPLHFYGVIGDIAFEDLLKGDKVLIKGTLKMLKKEEKGNFKRYYYIAVQHFEILKPKEEEVNEI